MKVAYICADPGVPVFGSKGCSTHVQEFVRTLLRQGATVEMFATRAGGSPPVDLKSVQLHLNPIPRTREPAQRERLRWEANSPLRKALQARGPFDLIYERYSLWSVAGLEYARSTNIPGWLEVNSPLIAEQARYRRLIDRKAAEEVSRRVFGLASGLVAVSAELVDYLERFPEARGRVHLLANGVDADRFSPHVPAQVLPFDSSLTVGFVGSLRPWHGLSTLATAFERVWKTDPSVRLIIVGEGPEGPRLKARLAASDMDNAVHWSGAVGSHEVPAWLTAMDVAVATYPRLHSFYFSPLKVYEYMAAGRAIVASRTGQLDCLLQDGVTGLLCPPGDAGALAAALNRLKREPGLRDRMGQAARHQAVSKHTWDAVVGQVIRLATSEQQPPELMVH
jgi:glycosyltransferase involved in cell wall biosynthesis